MHLTRGRGLNHFERRREIYLLYDIHTGALYKLTHRRLGQTGGIIFHPDRVFSFIQAYSADAIHFAQLGERNDGSLGRLRPIAV